MELTTEQVRRFADGQMRIDNPIEEDHFWGRIKTITVQEGELLVEFSWLAQQGGIFGRSQQWYSRPIIPAVVTLQKFTVVPVSDSPSQILRFASGLGETITLYQPDAPGILSPLRVEGLRLAQMR